MIKNVLVINGPNLNMLGKRPKEHYGAMTLDEINELIKEEAKDSFDVSFYQSNYEGDIITKIQDAIGVYDAIVETVLPFIIHLLPPSPGVNLVISLYGTVTFVPPSQ